MACCNLGFWVLTENAAGWAVVKIAKRREAVWVLAGIVGIYLAALHLALYWAHMDNRRRQRSSVQLQIVPITLWAARIGPGSRLLGSDLRLRWKRVATSPRAGLARPSVLDEPGQGVAWKRTTLVFPCR
jgi:hypothetical protein